MDELIRVYLLFYTRITESNTINSFNYSESRLINSYLLNDNLVSTY